MRSTIPACVLAFLSLAACSREAPPAPAATPPAAASASPAAPGSAGTLALGERITSPVVPLADIARDPAKYKDQTFATTGKVTAVCQEMGCWMQLEDASGQAHVRMHGHHFFVPKTAPGHLARVQATLVPANAPAGCENNACEEGKAASAKLELDATGVEID